MSGDISIPNLRFGLQCPKLCKFKTGELASALSKLIRLFKIPSLEDRCEDYGQAVIYRGTVAESPHVFVLDEHHTFETGRVVPVCGNTAAMLDQTRYARHFEGLGDRTRHFGPFACTSAEPVGDGNSGDGSCC